MTENILVIKLGALGDVILALGAFEGIRKHHKDARITLLTTRPFVDLAQRSGYFDEVIADARPRFWQLGAWRALGKALRGGNFARVYDLQANDRTGLYRRFFLRGAGWVSAEDKNLHAFPRLQKALNGAGIAAVLPDLQWMQADVSLFPLSAPYVLLVPGSSAARAEKRWPARAYAELAGRLAREGYQVVALGTAEDGEAVAQIKRAFSGLVDLSGQTSLYDIAELARGAAGAIGNDTGPMHLVAAMGCKTLALFGPESDPALSAPVGPAVRVIAAEDLNALSAADVFGVFVNDRD